ncbi:MAG TPA: tripartite tricarboxylate transporter substrate-binding protein [Xanthobacteraceae bacterium]|nr:tripartite tricarboxylate transporter substrate-binding protein [Xanthobacteraceae bacterium]
MVQRALIAAGLLLATLVSAAAQSWPNKPVRVIVPFTAGSAVDIVARAVMEQVSSQIGQPMVVENRGGAGGTLGVGMVAKGDPDGHTILIHSTTHAVTATTYTNPGYDARKDFAAITALASVPNVLVTAPGKYKSVKDMIEAGRSKTGSLNYASAGAGSGAHLNAERLLMAAGIKAQHIPFKGGPEALTEIMSGRVDFYFVPLPPARGLIAGKKVDALAVSSVKRAAALPDVPTTIEAGYPDSEYNFWVGMFLPVKTPAAITTRLHEETLKALKNPAVVARLDKVGAEPMPMSPAAFNQFVQKEIDINAVLVKAAGIEIN